jgi:hypothetical protein
VLAVLRKPDRRQYLLLQSPRSTLLAPSLPKYSMLRNTSERP